MREEGVRVTHGAGMGVDNIVTVCKHCEGYQHQQLHLLMSFIYSQCKGEYRISTKKKLCDLTKAFDSIDNL